MTLTDTGGMVESPFGRAVLRAEGAHLHLRAEANDDATLYVVRNALAEHLAMFIGEDLPSFTWSGEAAARRTIPFFHEMRVLGTRQVTPRMRRVTLAGGNVAAFEDGAGLHVRLLIPPAGRAPVWPSAAPDGRTLWPKGEDALIRRVYTVRRVDRAAGSIDIDMVLHEDDHDAPGSAWAASAQPGDPVGVMGPGGGLPPEADWYVLAGDETALPVIARIAENLPAGCLVHALIEVADAAEEQPILSRADLRLSWLHRDDAPAGSTDLLERALRAMDWPAEEAVTYWPAASTGRRGRSAPSLPASAAWRRRTSTSPPIGGWDVAATPPPRSRIGNDDFDDGLRSAPGAPLMLKAFFAYYRPHKRLFLLDFGCAVLSGLLELGFPMAMKAFVDLLLPQGDIQLIVLAALGLLAIYALNTGLMAIVTYWGHVLGINIETEMRERAFDHLQKLSFRFYDNYKTGHLVARVTKDLEEIGEIAHHGPEDLFIAVMTFIGALPPDALGASAAGAAHRADRPAHRPRRHPLWRAHDAELAGAVRPCRRLQRAAGGEYRRHPRGAGLRQRGL